MGDSGGADLGGGGGGGGFGGAVKFKGVFEEWQLDIIELRKSLFVNVLVVSVISCIGALLSVFIFLLVVCGFK